MPRGGSRPGAGAPQGNLNRLKYGQYSRQLRRALCSDKPQDWQDFPSRLKYDRFRDRVNMSAVLTWISSSVHTGIKKQKVINY